MHKVPWSVPDIGEEEKQAIMRVVKSGWLSQGKETKLFEEEICEYLGCRHAIVVNSGTSALITALLAHGIGKEDEVIVPSLTFIATVNAVILVGADPILVDVDLETFNTTIEKVEEKITKRTKAILPVDVAGMPINIDAFERLAEEHDLVLIEDAAEAFGAVYKNRKIGSFNHTSIFSFHIAKTITTVEGGVITTNDDKIAENCRLIRSHGMKDKYNHITIGSNFRITDIQSAMGRIQLKKVETFLKRRNELASIYMRMLKNIVQFQKIPDYVTIHPWMLFGVLVDTKKRDRIREKLKENGIDTRVCWRPVHQQPFHRKLFSGSFPNSEEIASRIINLPIGNKFSKEDIKYVSTKFIEIYEGIE